MNCLSASEQWLTVSRRGWGQCDRNMANFLHPDKITLHRLSQWCAKVSWLNRICVLYDFPLAPIEVEFVSWRYLPTAEWMFVFRHLLGPSARNRKSCQVNSEPQCTEKMPEKCSRLWKCFRFMMEVYISSSLICGWQYILLISYIWVHKNEGCRV